MTETTTETPDTPQADAAETDAPKGARVPTREENFGFAYREGLPTGEAHKLSPEEEAARKKRNVAIALSLVAFMALIFIVTVMQISQNIANSSTGGLG